MEAHGEPLLLQQEEKKVVYYGDCPGCRQDRRNEANAGIPYKEFVYIWVVALCSSLPISSLFPFLYFMPAEKFPDIFSTQSIFGRFPYFLPCLCISLFAVCALASCFWLPETLHNHSKQKLGDRAVEALEAAADGSDMDDLNDKTDGRSSTSNQSLLHNWPLISTIIVYCVFSLHDTAYSEIFSLWAESDKRFGGLSFSSQDVGQVLAISGFSLLLYQLFFYPSIEKALGPLTSSRVAAVIGLPLLAGYPFMANLSGLSLKLIINCASMLKNISSITITTGMNILQNNAVCQQQRGAANGISVTAMSLFKTCAPAGAGILFSWAQKHQKAAFFPDLASVLNDDRSGRLGSA